MIRSKLLLALGAVFIISGSAASGTASAQAFGVRSGLSVNPDQFYLGGHFDTGPIVDRVHLRPNLELGIGDDVTTVAVNIEAVYQWPLSRSPWTLYGGGGPAINFYDFDGGSETEPGFNLVGGLQHDNGFFFEVKGGLADSPDLKVGIGYTFSR